jgi:hypothetical protein
LGESVWVPMTRKGAVGGIPPVSIQATRAHLVILVTLAGADGAAALADGELEAFLHGDRLDQLTAISVLSPGMTISVPSGSFTTPVTSVVRK